MSDKTKVMSLIIFYIASLIVVFFITRNIILNECKNSEIKLERDLKDTIVKVKNIEKSNNELLKLNDDLSNINNELRDENLNMRLYLEQIKNIQQSTKTRLKELESTTEDSFSTIRLLRENNFILKQYFKQTSDIIGE